MGRGIEMSKNGYSKKLNQSYTQNPDSSITFQDGTTYAPEEMQKLSGQSDKMLIAVHKIKSSFQGEIII